MGRGPEEGVVDSCGAVFGHEDLYIADGSVMPGPVGPNPSLTIAALADRFADAQLEGRPAQPSERPKIATPAREDAVAPATGAATAVSFTEEMKGFVTFGEDDFDRGF